MVFEYKVLRKIFGSKRNEVTGLEKTVSPWGRNPPLKEV